MGTNKLLLNYTDPVQTVRQNICLSTRSFFRVTEMDAPMILEKPSEALQPSLTGRLRRQALAPLLEFLMNTQHTGSLELEGPDEFLAEIILDRGTIIAATCETNHGLIRGLDAIRGVLNWPYAYVTLFNTMPAQVHPNVTGSIMHLLLEAARLDDEAARVKPLPMNQVLRLRFNVEAYKKLGQNELFILNKLKRGMTLDQLKTDLGGMPVEDTILELIRQRLVEVDGFQLHEPGNDFGISAETHTFFSGIVPVRVFRSGTASAVRPAPKSLNPLHETVFALVDGDRSAERIRQDLRLSPGVVREALQALRAMGRIDY